MKKIMDKARCITNRFSSDSSKKISPSKRSIEDVEEGDRKDSVIQNQNDPVVEPCADDVNLPISTIAISADSYYTSAYCCRMSIFSIGIDTLGYPEG